MTIREAGGSRLSKSSAGGSKSRRQSSANSAAKDDNAIVTLALSVTNIKKNENYIPSHDTTSG
jgi:hypothetical protein